jgi:serine/threonine-protein kinase HipA
MGQHHMDICGEGASINRDHLLRLAQESGVSAEFAIHTIEQMVDQVDSITHLASDLPIRQATVRHVVKTVQACRARLASR